MNWKPSWEDAPEWAQFLTNDDDGWFWWESEPILCDTNGTYYIEYGEMEQAKRSPEKALPFIEKRPAIVIGEL